jgi:hypothetical protein
MKALICTLSSLQGWFCTMRKSVFSCPIIGSMVPRVLHFGR